MDLPEYLRQLYDYHYWANHRVLAAVEQLTPEQLHRQQAQSWGSVHGTLLHMTNAEWIWLRRWRGESPQVFPGPDTYPTKADLREHWANLESEMLAFVAAQTQSGLERVLTYTTTAGQTLNAILWQSMAHVPNHGTHHRAELAAMLAAMGVTHLEDDMNRYFLEKTGQR
jgi:uncharacterized damage-inducible protein DinB